MSNEELTLWKAAADQSSAATLTFLANFIVLRSIPQSATLLSIQTVIDFMQYYANEYNWNTFGPSRLRDAPTIDFAEAGVIRVADQDSAK